MIGFMLCNISTGQNVIAVTTYASCAEGLRFESDSSLYKMFPRCSPSSEWVPGDRTGEIKAVRKGTGHPTSHADGSGQVCSPIRHYPTYEKYTGLLSPCFLVSLSCYSYESFKTILNSKLANSKPCLI